MWLTYLNEFQERTKADCFSHVCPSACLLFLRGFYPRELALTHRAACSSAMSTAPEVPTGGGGGGGEDALMSKSSQMFKSCWSCRLISGGGLILSGAYVYNVARKGMLRGGPTSVGTVAQITFAACLAAWGVVVMTDPVGKAQRKT